MGTLVLAQQHGITPFEGVVARHVEHGALDLFPAQFARRVKQRQLLDFLVGRQQVAFHAVGHELQGTLARLARSHALLVELQALRNPLGQLGALHRVEPQGHAMRL